MCCNYYFSETMSNLYFIIVQIKKGSQCLQVTILSIKKLTVQPRKIGKDTNIYVFSLHFAGIFEEKCHIYTFPL